jgi:uncharacterized protein
MAHCERGADVGARSEFGDGRTALMAAVDKGERRVVEALLAGGADVNATDDLGQTALMLAAAHRDPEIVRVLLGAHAAVDRVTGPNHWTVLMRAADAGYPDNVRLLLDHGADANLRNRQGNTALALAREAGNGEVVSVLARKHGHAAR